MLRRSGPAFVLLLALFLAAGCGKETPPNAPKEQGSGPRFKVPPEDLVKDLRIASSRTWRWAPFFPEASMYSDRPYAYGSVPDKVLGLPSLQSSMDDKFVAAEAPQVSFTAARRLRVFVLYSNHHALLGEVWLNDRSGWQRENWAVETTLPSHKALRTVRSKVFAAGERVELGGTGCRDSDCDTYTVVIMPVE